MSTKIFDAYLLPRRICSSGKALFAFSKQIRRQLVPVSELYSYREMARTLAQQVDLCSAGLSHGDGDSAFQHLFQVWSKTTQTLREGKRELRWDFGLEWVFIFTPRGEPVIKLFGEDTMCAAFTKAFPFVRDYHYQNSTDKPQDISVQEWNRRARDWKKMAGSGSFAVNGLTMKLFGEYEGPIPHNKERILRCMPSLKTRARAIAGEIAFRDFCRIQQADKTKEEYNASRLFAFLRVYDDPENEPLRTVLANEVEQTLIPKLSLEHLTTPTSKWAVEPRPVPCTTPAAQSIDSASL